MNVRAGVVWDALRDNSHNGETQASIQAETAHKQRKHVKYLKVHMYLGIGQGLRQLTPDTIDWVLARSWFSFCIWWQPWIDCSHSLIGRSHSPMHLEALEG